MTAPAIIVDENDRPIGAAPLGPETEGRILRVVRVLLFNGAGEVLLQRRSADSVTWPLKWNDSAAGHVDEGESYDEAAARELHEEMGISVPLVKYDYFYLEEAWDDEVKRRFASVYTGTAEGEPDIDPLEVADWKWVPPHEVDAWIERAPEDFTPGFIMAWQRYRSSVS